MRSKAVRTKREIVEDVIKSILVWVVVTGIAFLYWLAMLLLVSIFLMNIWHTDFDQILQYSLILMAITSAGYAGILIYRKLH